MPPEPFFSGPGIDRADLLRAKPDELARLAAGVNARELVWDGGLPAVDGGGRLRWQRVSEPLLFLGLDGDVPCF